MKKNNHIKHNHAAGKTNPAGGLEQKDKVFSVTSFVCGILSWIPLFNMILGPMAIIFGVLAIRRVREDPDRYGGQGLAVAGLIFGILFVIFTLFGYYMQLFHPEYVAQFTNSTLFDTSFLK